jgi:hypothetical protein
MRIMAVRSSTAKTIPATAADLRLRHLRAVGATVGELTSAACRRKLDGLDATSR